ncbi:hypothetical protein DH2020_042233 [Rehmannia glutinosa]|uniref:DUF4220 domain-containing protein n=1 Tax=Rehmannia glutinosa TaxID=99300 RepID=A0ABR0UPA5_REHGL
MCNACGMLILLMIQKIPNVPTLTPGYKVAASKSRMLKDFPVGRLKDLWEKWDLRVFILVSLSLQTFLIVFAPLRKRTATNWITIPLWSAYLLADWAANFTIGLISSSQDDIFGRNQNDYNNADLLSFWAPFLLIHLGGPDTITAFSLEDNELWLRHFLSLVVQSAAAIYVFVQSLPMNQLWLPTVLMFISGVIKYGERIRSLYLASLNSFRESMLTDPDPGPNYAKLMDEYHSKIEANLPTRIEMIPEPPRGTKGVNKVKEGKLNPEEVVLYAHRFFETFKGLIVDLIFSFRERNQSRDFFLKRTAEDAFRVIEVELNFIYEVLFTKVRVVYTLFGYVCRFVSFSFVVASLGLFYREPKNNFTLTDVAITYTLLLGGIALDVIALIKLITSDWLLVAIKKLPDVNLDDDNPETTQESDDENKPRFGLFGKLGQTTSEGKIYRLLGINVFLDGLKYVTHKLFTKDLRNHIFQEVKMKSEMADDLDTAKEISAAKGDWILRVEGCNNLLPYVLGVDYDQSLLLWHIATELCYCDEIEKVKNKYRDFSKLLSDYMLYLLVMQPTMMSAVAGIGQIRFRDTCAEANKFLSEGSGKQKKDKPNAFQVVLYAIYSFLKYLFFMPVERKGRRWDLSIIKPVTIKGDRSKSVLFDGCILAKELKELEDSGDVKDKWEIMSKVWVELLSYAAIHCRANTHAQQLRKGGELLTLVRNVLLSRKPFNLRRFMSPSGNPDLLSPSSLLELVRCRSRTLTGVTVPLAVA